MLGLALAALMGLSLAGSAAWAQAGSAAAGAQAGTPAAGAQAGSPATGTPGDEALLVDPAEQPGSTMREPERLQHKPSGFWTSGRPAVGGAYRYRLLGIGVGVLVITGIVTIWVVRRHPKRHA